MSLAWSVRSRTLRLGLIASVLGLASVVGAVPVGAAAAISLTTQYPAVAVAPGSTVSFDVDVTTASATRVDLTVTGVPTDWTSSLRGGGFTVDGVQTTGTSTPTKVTLSVTVPATATAGTSRIILHGVTSSKDTDALALDIRVSPNAAGDVTLTTDTPQLKGASDTSFTFSLTLTNSTADDLPFSATATGPDGWTVTAQVGTSAQAASVVVKAGSTTPVTVTAKPADGTVAGDYPIAVDATSGSQTAHSDLQVTITGSYKLAMSTPNSVLSMNATAGSASDLTLTLTNSGTADIPGVAMSATSPTGWVVKFDPASVTVPAGGSVQVVAHVTPSSDAITGDYVTTMTATAPLATATTDIRVTVQTSAIWGAIGIGLIALVLLGLWLVFRRFGRR